MAEIPAPPPAGDLLDGLTEAQRRAVTSEAAPLCVVAGAGAGKTRVLTRRIAYRVAIGSAGADHVLALTFTRKAAAELSSRLRDLGLRDHVACGTFHALAAAQLRRWWADRRRPAPSLLDRPARLIGALVAERPAFAGVPLAEVMAAVDWARARGWDLDAPAPAGGQAGAGGWPGGGATAPVRGPGCILPRDLPVEVPELAALLRRYRSEKLRRGLVDFDDLLGQCADALAGDPGFAAAQRWRWRHLFVDEFQDLNPLQHRLLLAWLGPGTDLCAVGDPNQAIYGWNGADPSLIAGLGRRWPSTEVVTLDVNHRCTPQVVAAAAAVLGPTGAGLSSARGDGPPVEVRPYPTDDAEAEGVATALLDTHAAGRPWSSMAVLARTNAQALRLAEACRDRAVPVRVPGRSALLAHPAARRALGDLAGRRPAPVAVAAADLAASATAERGDEEAAGVLATLADLAGAAGHLDPALTVGTWLATLPAELGASEPERDRDAVTICSFHRAKGLEWDAVWVCGLEAGLVPIGRATAPAAWEEERRLLYVALTRAAHTLHCSWAERRRFGGHPVPRDPSPWLAEIEAATGPVPDRAAGAGEPSTEEWQRRVRAQRRRLGRQGSPAGARWRQPLLPPGWDPPDGDVLDALRSWREDAARASAVPAHVVLHDTVLVALASARPSDEAGLLQVPGIGPVKASRYGATLLSLVAPHGRSA